MNERYATTNTVAEKLLNDLKAAQAVKEPESEPEPEPAAPDPSGPRGKDGGAS